MFSSRVSVDINVDGTVLSYPMAASTAVVASAALCLRYTYHLAAYENFDLGGIQYPQCPLYDTAKAAADTEAENALASSDIKKKFMSHSNKRCEGEGEGEWTRFSFLPFSSAATRRYLVVKDQSVGNVNGTRDI